jgi:prepilin-type N-terminal cleavage/methylation domain-containing protein
MNNSRGFTLIEMAIVLVILTILVGGLLMPLTRRIEIQQIENTKKTLDEARDALYGYAMSHHAAGGLPYLPCPDSDNDGQENRSGSACATLVGTLPWKTLGLMGMDALGNRITYAVTGVFANNANGFSPGTTGGNNICSSAHCSPGTMVSVNAPVVLLSHGKNGFGALNVNNITLQAPVSADELENDDEDTDFVSHTIGGEGATEFDDIVTWIPSSVLFARVCPSGCP